MNIKQTQVLIIGAGPVGLLLARRLRQLNVNAEIIEQSDTHATDSRSIGIHPPGATMLRHLGLGEQLHKKARKVRSGEAHGSQRRLGTLFFSEGILTLSQSETMRMLDLVDVHRGMTFISAKETSKSIEIETQSQHGLTQHWSAQWLVACDGHHSSVRTSQGIDFHGASYPDHFIMGDFPESPSLGQAAHIFVHRDGLVEALPLDQGKRRWVALVKHTRDQTVDDLCDIVRSRTRTELETSQHTMFSQFTAQHFLASTMYNGRVILAGDAAHVMSPIGGQGMNVGWMDAWEIADILSGRSRRSLQAYSEQGILRAQKAIRTAERNMSIGRPCRLSPLRSLAISAILRVPPIRRKMDPLLTLQCVPFNSGL